MLKDWIRACSFLGMAASMLASSAALAIPTTYSFTSGNLVLSVTDSVTGVSVLQGTDPLPVPLGGSFVDFDSGLGMNGTITNLEIIPASPIVLNLDETVVALDTATITGAMLTETTGALGVLTGSGGFTLDTMITGTLNGILGAGAGGGPTGPSAIASTTSGATGTFVLLGDTVTVGILGVNLATFPKLASAGGGEVIVKADFTFIGIVPEPGTALLLGLGLAGLGAAGRRRGGPE